jgi:hypothetical protein
VRAEATSSLTPSRAVTGARAVELHHVLLHPS